MYDQCSHLNITGYIPTFFGIGCTKCGSKMEWYFDTSVAIEEWNKRA